MNTIRELFSEQRPIDRPIEKVIDYTADEPTRLSGEIGEYIVTRRLEDSFRRFIEAYDAGVRRSDVTEVGVWVSGFYGSGKSSFTKYLGFALDPERHVDGTPFLDHLVQHFDSADLRQLFRATAMSFPAAVVMLDLARDQLVENTGTPITNVMYAKVLQRVGYSKVPKLADLEVRLDEAGRLDEFRQAYRQRFPGKGEWEEAHDDPLIGPVRASHLVPAFLDDFPTPEMFRQQVFQERLQVSELAQRMVRLLRRHTGRDNIIFVVDEVGQYVAPQTELMLNLDGLVRSFKEIGRGKVWFVATAQQNLSEIVDRAVQNSAELYRLRDRFPIPLELDAGDIREITHRRLLSKRSSGERELREMFRNDGEGLKLQTRVHGFGGGAPRDLDGDVFAQMYPFLPLHFDIVMALIRRLARRTGGTGLRSAIRVVQDLLVDASRALPEGRIPLAQRDLRTLACADDMYETLRADIAKDFPHVVDGVRKVEAHPRFARNPLAVRVARAIAVLQPLDDFPRTAENLAAVLYPSVGAPPIVDAVREVLRDLVEVSELGIVEVRGEQEAGQVSAAGYMFLSEKVRPLQRKRNEYRPTGSEKRLLQIDLLKQVFDPLPEARLDNIRVIRAGLTLGTTHVAGEGAEIHFALEFLAAENPTRRRRLEELQNETRMRTDWRATVVWLVEPPQDLDRDLEEACRSAHAVSSTSEHEAERDEVQFVRGERRRLERAREVLKQRLATSLHDGFFVFQGVARPAREYDPDQLIAACNGLLARAAADVFPAFRHAAIGARTNLAERFLEWERLDRMPRERDPLGLVETRGGQPRVRLTDPPLSEVVRAFTEKIEAAGTGRLQGAFIQDYFAEPPYGWFKDTTRYLFAALLVAGMIEIHTSAGVLKTAGPAAVDAFRNTASFNRVGVSLRGSKPPIELLDAAARHLESLFNVEVLPLEDHISRTVRAKVPGLLETVASLPDRLRLLDLQGEERARRVLLGCSDLLQDDAGGAVVTLGDPQGTLPSDVRWARETARSLDGDGESTVRRATTLLRQLAQLAASAPECASLAHVEAVDAIRDVLAHESIGTKMADLRAHVRALEQAVRSACAELRSRLEREAAEARRELEALPDWSSLEPEDQDGVAARLRLGTTDPPADDGRLVEHATGLATSIARMPGLVQQCRSEVQRLARSEPSPGRDDDRQIQRIALRALVPPRTLQSQQDVENWLDSLRARLVEMVGVGPICIVEREDG